MPCLYIPHVVLALEIQPNPRSDSGKPLIDPSPWLMEPSLIENQNRI